MINNDTIKRALDIDVVISPIMAEKLQLWVQIYENMAPWLSTDITSLNLGASISSEIARAVTIEMKVDIAGSGRAPWMQKQFDVILLSMRRQIEYGVAKGGLIMKPYLDAKNDVNIDYVQADQFYPVAYDSNGKITSVVFSDQRTIGKNYYTRLEYHNLGDKGYRVINMAFKSTTKGSLGNKIELTEVEDWADLEPDATITGVTQPLFAYFRYPLTNNIDTSSPLGVSCFARADNLIRQADEQWSNLMWEFESGKRALYADILAFGKDTQDRDTLPVKRLYRSLDFGGQGDDMFKEWTPSIREQSILEGLNAILKRIEFTCGLAYGTISDPNLVEKTATEIQVAKQRSAATVVDTQKALESALVDLSYAIGVWADIGSLAPRGKVTLTFDFDDSLIVDADAQFSQDLQLVSASIMGAVEWRMRNFKEDEETAKAWIAKATEAQREAQMFEEGA